jgi:DNA-binding MarR family transcriptional regulator
MPLGRLLSWTGLALDRYFRRAVAEHGLSATALGVLGVLADDGGISHRDVAGRLGVAPATLTPVVDALAAAGHLERERHPVDRRVVRLSITPAGRDRLASTVDALTETLRARLPTISTADQAVVRRHLLAVLAAVDPTRSDLDSAEPHPDRE